MLSSVSKGKMILWESEVIDLHKTFLFIFQWNSLGHRNAHFPKYGKGTQNMNHKFG